MLYLDSSALIKRYVQEIGSRALRQRLEAEEALSRQLFTSVLTFAEVHCALAQRRKDKSLSKRRFEHCRQGFDEDWGTYATLQLDTGVLAIVRQLAELGLKGADTVHLASAMSLRDSFRLPQAVTGKITFVTSDQRLSNAAALKSFPVFNPQLQL